jgi:hypothetical protein
VNERSPHPACRPAIGLLVTAMAIALTACAFDLRRTPTGAEQPAGNEFAIALDNRSESPTNMVLYQETSGPGLTVGPCEASTLSYTIDGPFSLRFGDRALDDSALPAVATSEQLTVAGEVRVLVRIAPDGSVTMNLYPRARQLPRLTVN